MVTLLYLFTLRIPQLCLVRIATLIMRISTGTQKESTCTETDKTHENLPNDALFHRAVQLSCFRVRSVIGRLLKNSAGYRSVIYKQM